MKSLSLFSFFLLLLSFGSRQVRAQDVYANQLVANTNDVQNPQNIVDASPASFAHVTNLLTLLNTTSVTVDFPQTGKAGDVVNIVVDGTSQLLGVNLLNNTTFDLYDGNTLVESITGSTLLGLNLLDPNGVKYNIKAPTDISDNYTFDRVKVSFNNLLTVNLLNTFRIYSVFFQESCPPVYADGVHSYSPGGLLMPYVYNPNNAVSANVNDSALMGLPLGLLGLATAHLDLSFSDLGRAGDFVGFTVGGPPSLLNLNVLNNIEIEVYDENNNNVANKNGFSVLELKLLAGSSSRYTIGFQTPTGNYNIKRINIVFGGAVNLLSTMAVFNGFHYAIDRPNVTVTLSGDNILCPGESVTLTAFDSLGATNYVWNTSATTASINVNQAGIYSVSVTDTLGCTRYSVPIEVISVPNPTVQITGDTILCPNSSGTLTTVNAYDSYLWSTNNTANNVSINNPGQYFVSVTDSNGCSGSDTVDVVNLNLVVTPTLTNATCADGSNGAIALAVSGGSGNYSYDWSNGASTSNISNLKPGVYNVTITDAVAGCGLVYTFTIASDNTLTLQHSVVNTSTCGASDGAITVTPIGGSGSYTYTWSNSATTASNANLAAGIYFVTVTDNNSGCTVSDTISVSDGGSTIQIVPTITAVSSCSSANGSISLAVSGGTSPYTYSWSTGATTANISNLAVGTYHVAVEDAAGCTQTISIDVSSSSTLNINTVVTPSACNSNTGKIVTTVSNGSGNYSYQWSNGTTTKNQNNLAAGTYIVTVTDIVSGCEGSKVVTVNNSAGPQANLVITQPSCTSNDGGAVTVNMTTNGNYTYYWSTGDTSKNLSGLYPGTYVLTITNTNTGCQSFYEAVLLPKLPINLLADVTAVTGCANSSSGAIDITVEGGKPPFTYSWSNNATTEDISNLTTGTYTLNVTDDNGCTASIQVDVTIDSNNVLLATADVITYASCSSAADGSVTVNVTGGTAPYTYSWSNNATTKDLNNVTPGNYTLTVTDDGGCTYQLNVFIGVDTVNGLIANIDNITHVNCLDSTSGAIMVSVSGGASPYTYLWSNNATTEDLTNIPAGTYELVVSDTKGCTDTVEAVVNPATVLDIVPTVTNVTCYGLSDGSIEVNITNGTAPYVYSWNNGSSSNQIMDLAAGHYSVSVTDDNGCKNTKDIEVTQPDSLSVIVITQNDTCLTPNTPDGSIELQVSGGTVPYAYSWSTGESTSNITGLSAGVYTVDITDANGCMTAAGAELYLLPCDFKLEIYNVITPNGDGANDVWVIKGLEFYPNNQVRVFDKWGSEVFYQKGYSGNWSGTRGINGEPLPDGTYFYVIKLGESNRLGGENDFSGSLLIKR